MGRNEAWSMARRATAGRSSTVCKGEGNPKIPAAVGCWWHHTGEHEQGLQSKWYCIFCVCSQVNMSVALQLPCPARIKHPSTLDECTALIMWVTLSLSSVPGRRWGAHKAASMALRRRCCQAMVLRISRAATVVLHIVSLTSWRSGCSWQCCVIPGAAERAGHGSWNLFARCSRDVIYAIDKNYLCQ